MKLFIEDEKKEMPEPEVTLKLIRCGECIELIAVNEKGYEIPNGRIVKVTFNGQIHRFNNVNNTLGFNLDKDGKVELTA